ncbi:MAG: septum formation inhibitor Maf [Calditrichaeota bacterium]|nr:septum formation inhibitor Maf [Calditrichota bacterium]
MHRPLILASESPRRAQLLRQVGFAFTIIPANVDETLKPGLSPEIQAQELAFRKASQVARQVPDGFIVSADTLVVLDSKILGKPGSEEEAKKMLGFLSGRTHDVFTGFTIIANPEGKVITDVERTEVTFRQLEAWEIDRYIKCDQPLDKAGAYGIQDRGALFVESINGCYYNVVGFPLAKFYNHLKSLLIELEQ